MLYNSPPLSIWLGYDAREAAAFAIAKWSIRRYERHIPVEGLVLDELRAAGLYRREHEWRVDEDGVRRQYDVISNAPMSTDFAISRFLVPTLARTGFALFADGDILVRGNIARVFDIAYQRPDLAVHCVKHTYPTTRGLKKNKQKQLIYPRKNWSSVMVFNCDHPKNKALTPDYVNGKRGRELHGFCWLEDEDIGDLPHEWNYCVGHTKLRNGSQPSLVHFTDGLPDVPGYEDQEYADEWREARARAVGAL